MRDTDVFRFGPFQLSPARRELLLRGAPVQLGARAFDVLLALVKRQGQLATKDELMAEVWPATVVEENNLQVQISALRKVLNADPDSARCLQTVPARGYRFVGAVEDEAARNAVVDAVDVRLARENPSVVVLPFSNLSSDVQQGYFAQGMTETITTDLSRISGLMVIASSTAAAFNGQAIDVRSLCSNLGVRFALKGSVQRSGTSVRIGAQLVDGRSGIQVWSDRFDGDSADLFALQDRITGRIANSIGREVFVAAARDSTTRNIDPNANDLVMRGIAVDNKPQSLDGLREQERLFALAALLNPNNSDALARLARAILLQSTQGHVSAQYKDDSLRRGAAAAEKAVTVDPNNARAHLAMGLLHVLRGDFEQAALANETAIALDRNLAVAHNNLGNCLLHLGKAHEAVLSLEQAIRLDPAGPQIAASRTAMGLAQLLLGQTQQAVEWFSRARASNPKLVRALAGHAIALALRGDTPGARIASEDLLRLAPDYRLSQTIDAPSPSSPARYRQFYEETLKPAAMLAGVPV